MYKKNNGGFTLLEVVISITLVAIIVVVFSPVFTNILRTYYFNKSRITASNIAQNILEERRYEVTQGEL
ncbi:MAG: prepilin-type N-terminal cleavage/methylation domain-containing protein [Halanaerobiales bacterium]|nr:prepilin-type N-terminal cleavage/methylation domain-containing protein [Halanaerobiales bacterium]